MNEKIYLPLQLKALLPSDMYKVLDALFAFQKEGKISYSRKNAEFLHIDPAVADQIIQTAIDKRIIGAPEHEGGIWKFRINADTLERCKKIDLKEVAEKPLIQLATNITFKTEEQHPKYEMVNMTPEQMMAQMKMLQDMITMKQKQMQKNNDAEDGLPW